MKRIKLKSAASVAHRAACLRSWILAALAAGDVHLRDALRDRDAVLDGLLVAAAAGWSYPVSGSGPIALTQLFPMIPMADIISQYASDSIILVLSGMIITASWECTGLNKRIATAFLNLVGTSVRAQVMFWFLLSTALSTILPNLVVAATISPIAMSMLKYVGEGDIANSKAGSMVVMSVAWARAWAGWRHR